MGALLRKKPPKKYYPDVAESPPGRAIMRLCTQHVIFHAGEAADAVDALGYTPGYASGVLDRLVRQGHLVRIDRGRYRKPTTSEELEFTANRKIQLGLNDDGSGDDEVVGSVKSDDEFSSQPSE